MLSELCCGNARLCSRGAFVCTYVFYVKRLLNFMHKHCSLSLFPPSFVADCGLALNIQGKLPREIRDMDRF